MTSTDTQVGDQWGELERLAFAYRDADTPDEMDAAYDNLRRYVMEEAGLAPTVLELIAAARSVGTKGEARSEPKPSQHPIRGEGELLPCPFCGETEIHFHKNEDRRFFWAECSKCDVEARGADSEEDAREQWNRRAHPPTAYGKGEREEPVSNRYKFDAEIAWLQEAARYFSKRPTGGEDSAHWANVYNAENANKLATRLQALQSISGRTG